MQTRDPLRHHREHEHLHGAMPSSDLFGRISEASARFIGTPLYLCIQTLVTVLWIIYNLIAMFRPFDPFPFIFLNLAYSIQAGFAGPFVICAQSRQAERDKALSEADAKHREELGRQTQTQLADLKALIEAK